MIWRGIFRQFTQVPENAEDSSPAVWLDRRLTGLSSALVLTFSPAIYADILNSYAPLNERKIKNF
ncbi:hypothetical protein ACMYSP_09005 [Klebsiella sp. R390]|uniref:hypothetical protein n=1 Tax=Klebsiella sp. R390 TaxID=2755400 RepID=UPI003DA9E741